jgi:hypothetical protein
MLWNSVSLSVARIARNTSMIDTLKLAKRLQQANLSAEQSEAVAEADYLTKSELGGGCGIAHRSSSGLDRGEE